MVDANFAAAVAREAAPDARTLLLEIGPGTGCLTRALLAAHPAARVLAIEIDRGLVALLREEFAAEIATGQLTLLEGDALAGKHALAPELAAAARDISLREERPRRVLCANLPYNIATPVLANLAADAGRMEIESAIATVQYEMAERLLAGPGEAAYGSISIFIALRAEGKLLRRAGNAVFWPRPKVDSAVIRLDVKPWGAGPGPLLRREEAAPFQAFLSKLFSRRRKALRAALKPAALPPSLGLDPSARAEDLPASTLLELFRRI